MFIFWEFGTKDFVQENSVVEIEFLMMRIMLLGVKKVITRVMPTGCVEGERIPKVSGIWMSFKQDGSQGNSSYISKNKLNWVRIHSALKMETRN